MIVEFDKSFSNAISKIKDTQILKRIENAILNCEEATNTTNIKSLKKLVGYDNYYRIRVGDYRIGLEIKDTIIIFVTVLHRKNIYNKFP